MSHYKYAKALHDVCFELGNVLQVNREFEDLMEVLRHNEEYYKLLNSFSYKKERKYQILSEVAPFSEVFFNFLKVLINNKIIHDLEKIYIAWQHYAKETERIALVKLYTIKKLTKNQIEKLKKELAIRLVDKEIEIEQIIDRKILGGIRVVYKGTTIDKTFKSELDKLKALI